MVDRISALAGHYKIGKFGLLKDGEKAGVILEEVKNLELYQIAAWPDTLDVVGNQASKTAGCDSAPGPCLAAIGKQAVLLRIEPLKWWLLGTAASEVDAEQGATLDLSHSRSRLRVAGVDAAAFLNRHLSLDLRENAFPVGSVTSTVIHHVGVTLWRSSEGYELLIPRGFTLSLWEGFIESAEQFGLEVI